MKLAIPKIVLLPVLLILVVAMPVGGEEPPVAEKPETQPKAKPRVLVTISKETTYITEPLRPDGYPDYFAAMNQRMSKGVTPENNAAVLFWQAMGPGQIDAKDRDTYFQMLGIAPLPPGGAYFVNIDKYHDRQKDTEASADAKAEEEFWQTFDQLQLAMKRPWSNQEFPVIAKWLAANEKPLALLTEASKRPRRYDPLLPDNSDLLFGTPLSAVCQYRDVIRALTARAMLRASEGQIDQSWDDLLTCHRLANWSVRASRSSIPWSPSPTI